MLFLNKVKPKAAIFFETEIWPNSIHFCKAMEITSIVSNGRLSKKSFKKYMKLNIFFKKVFSNLDLVMAQGEEDKNYYRQLGCKNIHVTGSVKFDQGFDFTKSESLGFKKFLEHTHTFSLHLHMRERIKLFWILLT